MNIRVILIFFVILSAFFATSAYVLHAAGLVARNSGPMLLSDTRAGITPARIESTRHLIATFPLNSRLKNFYLVSLASQITRVSSDEFAIAKDLLAAGGFRYTPAQQNLMVLAAQDGDVRSLILRADALLRRGRLEPQVFELLRVSLNSVPVRREIVRTVGAGPYWRGSFLASLAAPSKPFSPKVLLSFLSELAASGSPASRDELAPIMFSLTAAGDYETTYKIWQSLNSRFKRDNFIDSLRVVHGRRAIGVSDNALPFDWSISEAGAIIALQASDDERYGLTFSSALAAGDPLVSRVLRLSGQQKLHVVFHSAMPVSQPPISAALKCLDPNSQEVPLSPSRIANAASGGSQVEFPFVHPAGCKFSELIIYRASEAPESSGVQITNLHF